MNPVEIGVRIKKQRQLLKYTREELAELANITPRFCYDLELGNKNMSVVTLCSLRTSLNVSTDYLLFGETQENGFDDIISMLEVCPEDKLPALKTIISAYVSAVQYPEKE